MERLGLKMLGISGNINSSESNEKITLQELKASNEALRERLSEEEKSVEALIKECVFYKKLVFEYKIANKKMKSELNELKREIYESNKDGKIVS